GLIAVEKEEEVRAPVDFHYQDHVDPVAVDFTDGGVTAEDYAGKFGSSRRSAPFSWAAWSWYGNDAEHEAWDMTTARDKGDSLSVTERGEEIVWGKGGIVESLLGSLAANE